MKNYVDLTVRISPLTERGYPVTLTSPEGSCEYTLKLPFALGELAGVVFGVAQTAHNVATVAPVAPGPNVREFGERLYEALFRGDARDLLVATNAVARQRPGTGIRIRLSMNLEGPGMAEVASLPWELMRRKDQPPLVMSNRTLLVRSLDVLQPTDSIPYQPPLRILVVLSNPRGTASLNLDVEKALISKNWGLLPGVSVDFGRPIRSELRRQLATADYHVIHYMGHGDFDAVKGGALFLEHEDGSADLVTGEELALLLADELPELRLVFLNACKTGTISAQSGVRPFAGVATSLIKAGVPAVVAMQFPISDQAAISFADTFYQRIAQSYPVDAAIAEARKALYSEERSEWATPVLFLRSKDGVLFEPGEGREAAGSGATVGQAGSAEPATAPALHDPWGAGPADAFRVFLAAPNETLRSWHRQLSAELVAEGIRVAGSVPPPYEAKEHAAAVQTLVRRADLCVHLLGDHPGEPLDDTDARRTYPLEQCRIGLEAAPSQLVLIPEQVDIESIEDPEYAAFLRTLIARPRDTGRFELVRTGRYEMKGEILAKRRRLEEARRAASASPSGGAVRTAFVDVHCIDLEHATDLISYLGRRNITPLMMPSSDNSPTQALTLFEASLSKVPLFVVVFGSVTRDWVVNRLTAAAQFVTTHSASTRIAVYLAPPVKSADQVHFPPFYDVAANMTGFDAPSVDVLIEQAAEGVA